MADAATLGGSGLGSRQSALFASILDSARAGSASRSTVADQAREPQATETLAAASAPTENELKTLPVTREDIAALRAELKDQGFSDAELDEMEEKAGEGQGMTWGELLDTVEKKVATTNKAEGKAIDNNDQVQLLGLFGKLGFTAEQSQQMVDSLSRGETQSVWAAIDGKLSGLSGNESFHLSASELTALGQSMNLSADAQTRLAALFAQAGAEAGLSGQGIVTAMGLVKNELLAQVGQENQQLAEFRQAASGVLQNAWQRETTGRSSDLHQDDVARKAGQIVAMSSAQDGQNDTGLNALADVPRDGQGLASQGEGVSQGETPSPGGAPAGQSAKGETAQAGLAAELAAKAGTVATEQAGLDSAVQSQGAPQAKADAAAGVAHHTEANPSQSGFQQGATGGNAFGFSQNGQSGQPGHDEAMAELMSKIRMTGRTAGSQTAAGQTTEAAPTLAAMDTLKMSQAGQQAKTLDPALAARVAKQVESGILKNVGAEARQLTVNLTPDELGTVQVTLTVKDKEVRAVIVADNADTAALLQEQAAKIKQSLEDQGLKVSELDVRTGLSQDNQSAAWNSPERHNEARDQREALERVRTSVRLAREAGGLADHSAQVPAAMAARASGLDLFA
jgi:flagellar hook-length control protein FliK